MHTDRITDKEQPAFWKQVQIQKRIWIKILGRKTAFKFDPNLFGAKPGLEKSDKFPKILICLDNLEREFRLAWLYGKIWSFIQASFDILKIMKRVFQFEFKLSQAHLPSIPRNYKMKHCRLHIIGCSENYGCYKADF
jgi:hypothetical protein